MTHDTEVDEIVNEFDKEFNEPICWNAGNAHRADWQECNSEIAEWLRNALHYQLQKARHDWLREQVKELESWGGIGWSADDYSHEIRALIDRYQEELDQDKN